VEFNTAVMAASVNDTLGSAVVGSDGSTVVFEVPSLEENVVGFVAVLDFCGKAAGTDTVASVSYSDSEGNVPDLSTLQGAWTTGPTCREFWDLCRKEIKYTTLRPLFCLGVLFGFEEGLGFLGFHGRRCFPDA